MAKTQHKAAGQGRWTCPQRLSTVVWAWASRKGTPLGGDGAVISRWSCLTPPSLPTQLQATGWQLGASASHLELQLSRQFCDIDVTYWDTEATTR